MTPPNHEEISAEERATEDAILVVEDLVCRRRPFPKRWEKTVEDMCEIVETALLEARRQALEEAAAIATEYAQWHDKNDDGLSGFAAMSVGAEEVADRIRALIHQTKKEG